MKDAVTSFDAAYDRIEKWQREFLARHASGDLQYYADAASGLNIALQELDKERWERTNQAIWNEYQAAKCATDSAKPEAPEIDDQELDRMLRVLAALPPSKLDEKLETMKWRRKNV